MVKIRLMRMGAKKRPFYRVVVADARSPRDGRFIENIGKYQPLSDPSVIEIDEDRALHWLGTGAQPTDAVKVLMHRVGIWDKFKPEEPPRQRAPKADRPSKKAAAAEPAPEAPEASAPPEETPAADEAPAVDEAPSGEPTEETMEAAPEAAADSSPATAEGEGQPEEQ